MLFSSVLPEVPTNEELAFIKPPTPFYAHFHSLHNSFVGRINERVALTHWYESDKYPFKVIVALGGFGKSSLAWTWMRNDILEEPIADLLEEDSLKVKEETLKFSSLVHPEASMWWSFYAPESGGETRFLNFLSSAIKYFADDNLTKVPKNIGQQISFLINALNNKRTLLILDGFERELEFYADTNSIYQGDINSEKNPKNSSRTCSTQHAQQFLQALCNLNPKHARVLITSRIFPQALDSYRKNTEMDLKGLAPEDSLAFLRSRNIMGSGNSLQELCSLCENHPLALRLLTGIIEKDLEHPNDVKAITNSRATQLLYFKLVNDSSRSQTHIFEYIFKNLSKHQRQLHNKIACFRIPVDYKTLKNCFANFEDVESFNEILHELCDLGILLFEPQSITFDMHPLVRKYSYKNIPDEERRKYHKELFGSLHDGKIEPATEARDLPYLYNLFSQAIAGGELNAARELFLHRIFALLHHRMGYYSLEVKMIKEFLAKNESETGNIAKSNSEFMRLKLSVAQSLSGEAKDAIDSAQKAIKVLDKISDQDEFRGNRLSNLAFCLIPVGELKKSDSVIQTCKDIFDTKGQKYYKAITHVNHGLLWLYCGSYDAAEAEFELALEFFTEKKSIHESLLIWSHRAWGATLSNNLEIFANAIREMRRLLPNSHYRNDKFRVAWHEATLLVYQAKDEQIVKTKEELLKQAEDFLKEAFSYESVELAKDLLLNLYHTQSMWYFVKGDFSLAESSAKKMLEEAENGGYRLKEAEALLLLAEIELNQNGTNVFKFAERSVERAFCDGEEFRYLAVWNKATHLLNF